MPGFSKKAQVKYSRARAAQEGSAALLKPTRIEDPEYLDFLRSQTCEACGASGTEASHTEAGGIGTKCSDYLAIPLCPGCHRTRSDSWHQLGAESFCAKYGIIVAVRVERLQRIYQNAHQLGKAA